MKRQDEELDLESAAELIAETAGKGGGDLDAGELADALEEWGPDVADESRV